MLRCVKSFRKHFAIALIGIGLSMLFDGNIFAQDYIFASLLGEPINTSGWNMQGAAKTGNTTGNPANSEIILTEAVNTSSGAIFYNTPINLSQCKKWVAEFEFRIFEGTAADGISFCYLDVPPSGFVTGGGIGIPASANGLKVVLDTYRNCDADQIPKLQIRWGAGYDECNGQPTRNNNDGQLNFVRSTAYNKCKIEYNEGNIKVALNGVEYLSAVQTFNFTGYFGFTASTGGSNDRHSIRNVKIYTEMPPSYAGNDLEFCPGGMGQLGGAATTGYSYNWSPATGLSSPTISSPFVSLTNSSEKDTTYQYIVETSFTDKPGCSSRDSVLVKVLARPFPAFYHDTLCLPGGNVPFKNTSRNQGALATNLEYSWDFGDPASGTSNTSTLANPLHVYSTTGPYTVQLAAKNPKGCVDTLRAPIRPLAEKPIAQFAYTFSGCLADSARFTSNAISNNLPDSISSWRWFFAPNANGSGKTIAHRFPNPGAFTAKHVVTSSRGCVSDTVTQNVVVNPNPVASFTLTGPFCQNKKFSLANTSTSQVGAIVRWVWIMGNGDVLDLTNGDPFTYAYTSMGTFTIKLVVTTSAGCQSDTAKQTVTVGYVPVPAFLLPDVCLNDAYASFANQTTIGNGDLAQVTWLWNYGDPNANAGNPNAGTTLNGLHRYTATGNYPIKLIATTSTGCRDSLLQTLTVNGDKPVASFDFVKTGAACANLPVEIRNKSTVNFGSITRIVIYWNNGANITDTTDDELPTAGKIYSWKYPAFSSPATKQVSIRLLAYSGGVCVSETTKTLILHANPVADFLIEPAVACLGEIVRFTDQSSSAANITGWNWTFGDGNSSNQQNPSHAYKDAGDFSVVFYSITGQGCISNTIVKEMKMFPVPVVSAGPDRFLLQGGQVVLLGEASGSANYSYSWGPDTWLSNPAVAQPVCKAQTDITYRLTVTADGGCAASDEVFVKVLLTPLIPNAFSPNGDGINETWVIHHLDSYPGATVQVFDRYGKSIFFSNGYNKPWDGTVGGAAVPVGTYYYIVRPGNGLQPLTGSVTILK